MKKIRKEITSIEEVDRIILDCIMNNVEVSFSNVIFTGLNFYHSKYINSKQIIFHDCVFVSCSFENVKLQKCSFYFVTFDCVEFTSADLTDSGFYFCLGRFNYVDGANLKNVIFKNTTLEMFEHFDEAWNIPYIPMACPDKGSFIGYKKAYSNKMDYVIVELKIPEDARRSSAFGRKCRCDKAIVLDIYSLDGERHFLEAKSIHDENFIYRVGKIMEEPNFNENRYEECTSGIHFFINKQEAINY